MAHVSFDIDGFIGEGGNSRQYVKAMMKDAGTDLVNVNISSLGGDINHGLGIHDLFVDNGNVQARLSGFVASAATTLACGAKTVKMNSTGLYLVHKVSGWVDEWGYMNEDELKEVIDRLTQDKEENQKIDLIIANIYAAKTGKPLNEIADLMKKSTWLNASEAKEWGFVDEIIEMTSKTNILDDKQKVAMIMAAGLPMPPLQNQQANPDVVELNTTSLLTRMKEMFFSSSKPHKPNEPVNMDKTKFAVLLNTIGVDSIETDKDGGAYLTCETFEVINTALTRIADAEKVAADATAAQEAAQLATEEANTAHQAFVNQLNSIDSTVADAATDEEKVAAIIAKLASKPGASNTNTSAGDHSNTATDVDWDTINNLPHNKVADQIY